MGRGQTQRDLIWWLVLFGWRILSKTFTVFFLTLSRKKGRVFFNFMTFWSIYIYKNTVSICCGSMRFNFSNSGRPAICLYLVVATNKTYIRSKEKNLIMILKLFLFPLAHATFVPQSKFIGPKTEIESQNALSSQQQKMKISDLTAFGTSTSDINNFWNNMIGVRHH